MIYRNRKTGKLVVAEFSPAFETPISRQADVYYYHTLRDGKAFGPVRSQLATRFLELYEAVPQEVTP